jgi:glycosyltransferase involved in cell wall biosynthesis
MKILIVIEHLEIGGGAERVAVEVAEGLKDKGHDVTILTFKNRKECYSYSGKIISLDEKSKYVPKIYKLVARAKKIKKICKKEKIDSVVSHLHTANFSAILSKCIFKNKSRIIVSEHNNTLKRTRMIRFLLKRLYPKADLVVAVSKQVEYILNKNFKVKKTKTIYNFKEATPIMNESKKPIDEKHKNLFKSSVVFFTIGRLTKQKNHSSLIRAFKKVISDGADARLIIRGSGEYEKKLRELIKKTKLEENVIILEKVENIFSYIAKSDGFILSSNHEGLPLVLLEALALSKPVISTDCISGPREIICPELEINQKIKYPYYGKYGILVEPMLDGNDFNDLKEKPLTPQEEKLADVMIAFAKDETLRKKYNNGLERAKDFDKNEIIEEWEKIL